MSHNEIIKRGLAMLDKYEHELGLQNVDVLNKLHLQSGQKRIHLVVGGVLITLIGLVSLFGMAFLSNIVAFYPLYNSFKALRTPEPHDDQYWLTYWVVFGSFTLFESLVDRIFFWMPLYYLIKAAFLVWCFHPSTKGALIVYQRILGPLFVGVQREVDELHGDLAEIRNKRGSVQQSK